MSRSTILSSDHVAVVLGVLLPMALFASLLRFEPEPNQASKPVFTASPALAATPKSVQTVKPAATAIPDLSISPTSERESTSTSPATVERKAATAVAQDTPSIPQFADGWVVPPPPYFAFGRPFVEPQVVRPSRFYAYGTDAGGQLLLHHGVDISNPLGDNVRAVGAGRVVFAGDDLTDPWGPMLDFYGQLVVIEHALPLGDQPLFSLYGHVETITVRPGQVVMAGETIATVGGRGIAMGPHLHLEFRTDAREYSKTFNPELFFAPLEGHGTIVVRVRNSDGARMIGVPIALYSLSDTGEESWITQVPSYSNQPVNSAWRWEEDAVFGDLPIGRYVVRARSAFQASVEVIVRPRGATVVTLVP